MDAAGRSSKLFGKLLSATVLAALVAGCASFAGGPPRLYPVAQEVDIIRSQVNSFNYVDYTTFSEPRRQTYRNDWLAARMYAIDLYYTEYEAALTRERQSIGFGTTVATLGLTTASKLVTPVATKDALTSAAGLVTGARAAYNEDVLLAHTMQWVQSQMRTQRARVADRILRGMRLTTSEYTMTAALSDLEEYYRAGTFTGGLISTTESLAAEAKFAELLKSDRVEVTFVSTDAGKALSACIRQRGVTQAQLASLMPAATRTPFGIATMLTGGTPEARQIQQDVLRRARQDGLC